MQSHAMSTFVLRRLIHGVVVVFSAAVLVFVVTRIAGDPVNLLLPLEATDAQRQALREELGFADPLLEQFKQFIVNAAQGDLGSSVWQHRPAIDIVIERLPATLLLAGSAFGVSLVAALILGTLAALRPGSLGDKVITSVSLLGISTPNFFLALVLVIVLAGNIAWLPTAGYGSVSHLILPTLSLAALSTGRITQIVRSSVIDELGKPYVIAALGRGASQTRLLFRHVLKNAGIPIVTLAGLELVRMLAGYMVPVEAVFSWPGLGLLAKQAVEQFDFFLIQAVVLVVAVMVVVVNLVIEILYAVLNPRIKLG